MSTSRVEFRGNDRVLLGFIFGLLGFWLFAMTMMNIGYIVGQDLGVSDNATTMVVSLASLFSGIFIVLLGSLADRLGRVKLMNCGFIFAILGSLFIAFAQPGALALPMLIIGRVLQGLSGAAIMPSTLALLKEYWDGPGRARAISMWSIGSWGGSGFCSIFGGFLNDQFGWRSIFISGAVVSLIGMLLVRGVPESRGDSAGKSSRFDFMGLVVFLISMISLQQVITRGSEWGWSSPLTLVLLAVSVIGLIGFYYIEIRLDIPFVDFRIFKNKVFTGATISNFLVNCVAGIIMVSLTLMQQGAEFSPGKAGTLTLGYAIAIVAFMRVGELLLRRFGPRRPMLMSCVIVAVSIGLLLPTHVMTSTYSVLTVIAYTLFGVGLAFYATPSTAAALNHLPADMSATGAGIYKMASSLGAAFGIAISASIYQVVVRMTDLATLTRISGVVEFVGRQDNVHIRQAAMASFGFNVLVVAITFVVIFVTIPKDVKE